MLINLINVYTYKCDNLAKIGKDLKNIFASTIQFLGVMTPSLSYKLSPRPPLELFNCIFLHVAIIQYYTVVFYYGHTTHTNVSLFQYYIFYYNNDLISPV